MRKVMDNDQKKAPEYQWIEKNIYKTGGKYRVRVGNRSGYATSKTKARTMRKLMKFSEQGDVIV